MTQQDQVRRMLEAGWTCGTEFLDERLPRYAARIHELRADGVLVERRACERHSHRSGQFEWRAVPEGQGILSL